jgi:hypothetical protein
MALKLPEKPDFLAEPSYLPRVTQHDGRAIEAALSGPTLFDRGVRLRAVVVEATYAAHDPPLLKRLRDEGVPQIIDPQTLRLTGERYLSTATFHAVPYAPREDPFPAARDPQRAF